MSVREGSLSLGNAGSLIAEARRHDPDRLLAALFAPAAEREVLAALILVNHELARIPEVVSQPMAGMIRYQWWRDGVEAAARGAPVGHPALAALAAPLAAGRLAVADIVSLIDAREHDLEQVPPTDLEALEAYAAATSGRLHELLLQALGCREAVWLGAARAVGTGLGLIGLVRAVAFHARQSRLYMPERLLSEAGVGHEEVLAAQGSERLRQVTGRIVERGLALIESARRQGPPPRAWLPALLPARAAAAYARRLRRAGYDPFTAAAAERSPARLPAAPARRAGGPPLRAGPAGHFLLAMVFPVRPF